MLKIKELIESVALEAWISWVREHFSWKDLYALSDKSLMKVKQVIEHHEWIEKISILRHKPSCFY